MNSHARKRLTETVVIVLDGLIVTEGRTITVSEQMAKDIHAIAYDLLRHIPRIPEQDAVTT